MLLQCQIFVVSSFHSVVICAVRVRRHICDACLGCYPAATPPKDPLPLSGRNCRSRVRWPAMSGKPALRKTVASGSSSASSKPAVDTRSVAARIFAILDAFAAPAGVTSLSLTLTVIAQRAGLPLSTTHRLVAELVQWGGLTKQENGQYSLGIKLWELGVQMPTARNLRTIALPYLEDLYESTREHVHLAILDGRDALYLEKLSGHHAVRLISRVGSRLPLHSTGVGLVLLAYAPTDVVQDYLSVPLQRFLPRTVTSPDEVRKRLAAIRVLGVAHMSCL